MSTRLAVVSISLVLGVILPLLYYGPFAGQEGSATVQTEDPSPSLGVESLGTAEVSVDDSRDPLGSAASTDAEVASTPSEDLEVAPADISPLERLMHPVNAKSVRGLIEDVKDESRPHQSRLTSASFALAASIAVRMEIAGTGSSGTPPGGVPPHPAELFRFAHNGRDYYFDRGEFPVWDEVMDLLASAPDKRNRGEELDVPESLYLEVQELAEQVVRSVEEFNRRDEE